MVGQGDGTGYGARPMGGSEDADREDDWDASITSEVIYKECSSSSMKPSTYDNLPAIPLSIGITSGLSRCARETEPRRVSDLIQIYNSTGTLGSAHVPPKLQISNEICSMLI